MFTGDHDAGDSLPDFLNSVSQSWSQTTHQGRLFFFDAFISHSSEDVELSRKLADELRASGLRIWHDAHERMDDARWTLRLVTALRNSRFVIVVATPESNLMHRPWVLIECKSAIESEALLPGIPRLLIGRTTLNAPVPACFVDHKQFDLETKLNELVAFVQAGNRLPSLGRTPLPISTAEARALVGSADPSALTKQGSSKALKSIKQEVLDTLMTEVNEALVETEANPSAPSGLYTASVVSGITLDEPVRNDEVQRLIPVLELLTAIGHTESRAQACICLRGLATWGATSAAAALRRVIVREEDEHIVKLVAGWFGRTAGLDWTSFAAEYCARVLLMLPKTNIQLREQLYSRLTSALRIVALPEIVYRVTSRAFDQLESTADLGEAQARFDELRRSGHAADWEVYFRELENFVGVAPPLVHCDRLPNPERVNTYLLLISEFARVELERGSNMIWHMYFEPAILEPLAKLSVHVLYRDRAMTARNAVLNAMEASVFRDLEPRRGDPFQARRVKEQESRLFLIEACRRGPYFEQMENGIYVRLISSQDSLELLNRAQAIRRVVDGTNPLDDIWAGVNLY